MGHLIKFTKDESGAVTVDWVVLTAAIVGIALAVIVLISSGVEDASGGINDELLTAGSGWNFLNTPSTTLNEYVSNFVDIRNGDGKFNDTSNVYQDIFDKINADSPADYTYTGLVDLDGYPIYASNDVFDGNTNTTSNTNTYSVNGSEYNQVIYEIDNGTAPGVPGISQEVFFTEQV